VNITITRVYAAPREAVWRAWTAPEQIAAWWGKRGWRTPVESVTIDLRPGGAFRLTSVSEADGTAMPTDAVFREVVPGERLAFAEAPRPDCHAGAEGVVTFAALPGGGTEMVFRTTLLALGDFTGEAAVGMASAFDRLAEHLR
jgi:uncharacterized protein YndB with AHSA1/START domain